MKKTLAELRARLKAIAAECKTMVDAAEQSDSGIMAEAEQTAFDSLCAEHEQLKAEVDRRQKFESMHQDTQTGRGRQSAPGQPAGAPATVTENVDPQAGFMDMGDFASAVRQACVPNGRRDGRFDIQAAPSNFHFETGSGEGYEVPPAFRQQIWELVYGEDHDLLSMVDAEPTNSNQVQLTADETTPWGSTGVQAYWRKEADQLTASMLATEGRDVKLHELYAFATASEELLEDAPRLANRLTRGAARAIRWKANEAIVNGTGAGQPLGWMKSGSLVTVAKESGQTADTLNATNVAKMYSRMLPSSLQRAVWMINSDALPQLIGMTIGDQPVFTLPTAGLTNAPNGMLLGRPILFSEHAETVGDKGDIQFVDPMGYYLARKQSGVKFDTSIHLFFDYNLQAFRWIFRLGGQPFLSAPVSPAKGTATKSCFVTLDARA